MSKFALMTGAALVTALLAGTALAGSAQAYEWGGGTCIGYGCVHRHVYDEGYRSVRQYDDEDAEPGVRVYERRIDRHHDWDDEDDDD